MLKEMLVAGVTVDPTTKSPIVILRDKGNKLALPIWVGALEANAIVVVLEQMEMARPMTHDLMRSLLESIGVSLSLIEIADVRDNTYYAFLHLEQGSKRFSLDSRPSDAIALALRCRAPIMVSPEVMEHALPIENIDVTESEKHKDKMTEMLERMDPEQYSKYKM
ncbi:MAG: bifunctional nuclease family protein [Syntrophorhabdaceae bacterium]|nr:bifunctional nuclease family protein [Syntrophorhabdaceae bacterium]